MIFWISSHDGMVNFKTEAQDVSAAFELLARSLQYTSFAELIGDTGRTPSDFQVARVEVEERQYDAEGDRLQVQNQRDNAVTGVFRQLLSRRNG